MAITAKSTKSEIWEAYQALLKQSQAEVITPVAIRNTAQVVAHETLELAKDLQRLGAWGRYQIAELIKIYNRPVLKAD
jgi:hypothetical protein